MMILTKSSMADASFCVVKPILICVAFIINRSEIVLRICLGNAICKPFNYFVFSRYCSGKRRQLIRNERSSTDDRQVCYVFRELIHTSFEFTKIFTQLNQFICE